MALTDTDGVLAAEADGETVGDGVRYNEGEGPGLIDTEGMLAAEADGGTVGVVDADGVG